MKAITDEKASLMYLRNLSRYGSIATVLVVLCILGGFFWLLANGRTTAQGISPILYLCAIGLSVCLILDIVRRTRATHIPLDRRYMMAWTLLALGLLACVGGGPFPALLRQTVMQGNQSALAYVIMVSLFYYPLTFVGLLFLSGARRWRIGMIFDALTMMLCILCLCWYFLARHTDYTGAADPLALLLIRSVVLSYPFNDLLLLYALIPLIIREKDPVLRFPLYLLAGAFGSHLWSHAAVSYMCLVNGHFQPGMVYIDWFWLVSFLLTGLAVLYQHTGLIRKVVSEQLKWTTGQTQRLTSPEGMMLGPDQELPRGWQAIRLIYIPLAICLCMFLISVALEKDAEKEGFIVLCALTGVLISIRYFYSARVNDALIRERDQHYQEVERVRHLVAQLSDIRDLEYLRERIVKVLLDELHFTFAMLLLVEEFDGALTNQTHLLVSAISKSAHLTKWRLRADNSTILSHAATSGKKTEINWDYHRLPAEIRNWQDRQHVPPMIFLPIVYRDRILGSLGVARHALSQHTQSEMTIMLQYTEQIAAILEHAYLYRQARDREAFARAMANISTRLNAAVVDLKEISQLICIEGAKALLADHVVLYLAEQDGQLKPLAASTGEDHSLASAQQWPPFSLTEYNDVTDGSLHPFLLDITRRHKMPASAANEYEHTGAVNTPSDTGARESFGPRLFALRTRLAHHFIQTVILAPLVHGGEMQGVLLFARATPPGTSNEHCFEFTDLPHAQDFVEQASVAFTNARLYGSLQDTHKRLQELDQLKDQFMITASHELRTPLTAVQGYIELIAQYDEVLPAEQRREFLQKAQLGCEELAVLLRNVMDASRLETEAGIKPALLDRVNVLEIIEKVQVMIEPLVTHEQREVHIDVPAYLSVSADPLRLHQVLMNISSNALKYSPPGSPITFAARINPDQGSSVIISITDRGKGVDPGDQAQLFQRFVRLESDLNSPIRGSGLGLYISRRLVEAMGGKIWIESRGIPGEGSTFHIQLPIA